MRSNPNPTFAALHDQLVSLAASEGFVEAELDGIRLAELDSLFVTEIFVIAEDYVGRPIHLETFDTSSASLGDVLRFCEANG